VILFRKIKSLQNNSVKYQQVNKMNYKSFKTKSYEKAIITIPLSKLNHLLFSKKG